MAKAIKSGVPQGSVLGSALDHFFTHDFPAPHDAINAHFADDTEMFWTTYIEIFTQQFVYEVGECSENQSRKVTSNCGHLP